MRACKNVPDLCRLIEMFDYNDHTLPLPHIAITSCNEWPGYIDNLNI